MVWGVGGLAQWHVVNKPNVTKACCYKKAGCWVCWLGGLQCAAVAYLKVMQGKASLFKRGVACGECSAWGCPVFKGCNACQ